MGIGPQNLGAMGVKSSTSPLNRIVGGGNKDKKKQKKYNQVTKDLNVNTTKDTLIGPSKNYSIAKLKGNSFDRVQRLNEIPADNDGVKRFNGNTPNPYKDLKGYRGKKGTEYYTVHDKNKYKK
jgi:hypothetical protein